jgi:hypothetical protein
MKKHRNNPKREYQDWDWGRHLTEANKHFILEEFQRAAQHYNLAANKCAPRREELKGYASMMLKLNGNVEP